jgi:hypothetical protein
VKTIALVRWGLPFGLLAGGVALLVFTDVEGVGEALIAASACVLLANILFRVSFSDVGDRDREERAREYFDEHGHWPEDAPR